ncbi:serine threonine protein kinase CMGC group [Mycoemilia scoparia]|uniref:Serine threonine protein kinase CMGC group n=1 Tax=Mycoemilia scoparia TaxID=417184 RepID=A0A9W8A3Y9_9FUNG|nr:serine threonine protein kinase CMGC group [Mycoemilia scoparia]
MLRPPWDDKDGHYIVTAGDDFTERYRIIRLLGQGTFGKVMKCLDRATNKMVAVKVVRAIQKYRDAAQIEMRVLNTLKKKDPTNMHQCIHMVESFDYRDHVCMAFDLLGPSVFDFLKANEFRPFSLAHVQSIGLQLLDSVAYLHSLQLVHTDLKPENILLYDGDYTKVPFAPKPSVQTRILKSTKICLIDFGSATFEKEYHSHVVSTRHYRAPEIILGLGWSYPCDMWSIGCILLELLTGEALFQTHEDLEHLAMMEAVIGPAPGRVRHKIAVDTYNQFYHHNGLLRYPNSKTTSQSRRNVRAMRALSDMVPPNNNVIYRELYNLLDGLLRFDASERLTAQEAYKHPFFRRPIGADGRLLPENRSSISSSASTTTTAVTVNTSAAEAVAAQAQTATSKANNDFTLNSIGSASSLGNTYPTTSANLSSSSIVTRSKRNAIDTSSSMNTISTAVRCSQSQQHQAPYHNDSGFGRIAADPLLGLAEAIAAHTRPTGSPFNTTPQQTYSSNPMSALDGAAQQQHQQQHHGLHIQHGNANNQWRSSHHQLQQPQNFQNVANTQHQNVVVGRKDLPASPAFATTQLSTFSATNGNDPRMLSSGGQRQNANGTINSGGAGLYSKHGGGGGHYNYSNQQHQANDFHTTPTLTLHTNTTTPTPGSSNNSTIATIATISSGNGGNNNNTFTAAAAPNSIHVPPSSSSAPSSSVGSFQSQMGLGSSSTAANSLTNSMRFHHQQQEVQQQYASSGSNSKRQGLMITPGPSSGSSITGAVGSNHRISRLPPSGPSTPNFSAIANGTNNGNPSSAFSLRTLPSQQQHQQQQQQQQRSSGGLQMVMTHRQQQQQQQLQQNGQVQTTPVIISPGRGTYFPTIGNGPGTGMSPNNEIVNHPHHHHPMATAINCMGGGGSRGVVEGGIDSNQLWSRHHYQNSM